MDAQITTWEMSLESEPTCSTREELATWPSEPYVLEPQTINWN
jgi:hypothetical protein